MVKGTKTKPLKIILKVILQTAYLKNFFNEATIDTRFSQEYQEQQKKSNFHIKELKREVDCLKQELDKR